MKKMCSRFHSVADACSSIQSLIQGFNLQTVFSKCKMYATKTQQNRVRNTAALSRQSGALFKLSLT